MIQNQEENNRLALLAYIEKAPFSIKLKQYTLNGLDKHRVSIRYLFNFPELFMNAFVSSNNNDRRAIDKISLAGYLMYLSIISYDECVDNILQIDQRIDFSFDSTVFHEEAVRTLSKIFSYSSPFWRKWNVNRYQAHRALKQDISFKNRLFATQGNSQSAAIAHYLQAMPHITSREYLHLAKGKSAVGRSAVDAAYFLSRSNDNKLYNVLLRSHDYFMMAINILDDISDIEKDLQYPQINCTHQLVASALAQPNNQITSEQLRTASDLKYHFYSSASGRHLFEFVVLCLNKSLAVLGNYEATAWRSFLVGYQQRAMTKFITLKGHTSAL